MKLEKCWILKSFSRLDGHDTSQSLEVYSPIIQQNSNIHISGSFMWLTESFLDTSIL